MISIWVVLNDPQPPIDSSDLAPMRHTSWCVLLHRLEFEWEPPPHSQFIRAVVVEVPDLLDLEFLIVLVDNYLLS